MLGMLKCCTLSQWQPNISPQSGQTQASLGTEKPKMSFISMAAQTGAVPGPGEEGTHLSCAGMAGQQASGRRASGGTAGMSTRRKGGKGADWKKGPKQERKRVKWAGKQARDPEAVHKTRQEKVKDNCM